MDAQAPALDPNVRARRASVAPAAILLISAPAIWIIGSIAVIATPYGIMIPTAAAAACLVLTWKSPPVWPKILMGVAALSVAAPLLLFVPMARDMWRHDRLHSQVVEWVCGAAPAPPFGGRVETCGSGGDVHNPSNGNQCAYPVRILVDSPYALTIEEHFASLQLPASFGALGTESTIASVDADLITVDWLAIGDEGADPRCS